MSDYRFGFVTRNDIDCLHVMIDSNSLKEIADTHIPLDDILEAATAQGYMTVVSQEQELEAPIPPNTLRNADGTAFQAGYDESKTLEELVFTALGEASMCWSERPKGVFDDVKAKQIGKELCNAIRKLY